MKVEFNLWLQEAVEKALCDYAAKVVKEREAGEGNEGSAYAEVRNVRYGAIVVTVEFRPKDTDWHSWATETLYYSPRQSLHIFLFGTCPEESE